MTIDRDLFLGILAMDAYNRGYGAGIRNLPESGGLGAATIRPFEVGDKNGWEAAGFYAIAYDVSGVSGLAGASRVISYRGPRHGTTATPPSAPRSTRACHLPSRGGLTRLIPRIPPLEGRGLRKLLPPGEHGRRACRSRGGK